MKKAGSKKRVGVKKKRINSAKKENLENLLIENFVSLQKVMADLSEKFDRLSKEISSLLKLFEVSARTLAQKEVVPKQNKEDNKELIDKLNTLLEQNKIIAKGLALLHENSFDGSSFNQDNLYGYSKSLPIRKSPVIYKKPVNQESSNQSKKFP